MLGPGVRGFPEVTAVQAVVEEKHVVTVFDLAVQAVLDVEVTAVEFRFDLQVDTGHVRSVAHGTGVESKFILAPGEEARRVAHRERRVEVLLEEDGFDGHRPALDVLALGLHVHTDLRSVPFAIVGVLLVLGHLLGAVRLVEVERVRHAQGHIGHQVELRSDVALEVDGGHVRIHDGGVNAHGIVLGIEFRFVEESLVEHDTHVVEAHAQVLGNLVLGEAAMVHGTAQVVVTRHFEFTRLATEHAQTVAGTDVHVCRLGNHRLGSHVERKLVGAHEHATEGAVGPEGTAAFLHGLEHLFLIVGTYSLFVFEGFVHPTEAGHGLAFPHGERRGVCPNDAACSDVGTEHARTDIDTEVHFFVDSRGVVVGGVVEQHTFVGGRHVGRLRTEVVAEQAREVEREREVRPEGHVGVRHRDDVRLEHSVDRGTGLIASEVFGSFRVMEVLEAEGHETGHGERSVILTHEGGFQVLGDVVHVAFGSIQLVFSCCRRRSVDHRSRCVNRSDRGEFLLRGRFFGGSLLHRSGFLDCRFGGSCRFFGRSSLFGGSFLYGSGLAGSLVKFTIGLLGRRRGFFHRLGFRCGGV